MKALRLSLVSVALLASLSALAEVKSADVVMKEAFAKSKSQHKAVFLSFHASWCGWCHKFEDFLKRPDIKPIWENRFEMVWLTVLESPDKKADENAGGDLWLKKVGGENQGIPYMAIFNSKGEMLSTSLKPGEKPSNIGYPAAPEEIDWFMTMIQKGAPNVTAAEAKTIRKALEEEAQKIKH